MANSLFKKNKNIIYLCRYTHPIKFTFNFLKTIPKKSRVLYVSVDKSFPILTEKLKDEKIDYSKWFFIDCMSSSFLTIEKSSPQCEYLSSPKALVDLAIAIDDKMKDADVLIFDNITSLLVYNDTVSTLQMLNGLMAKVRKSKLKAIYFLCHDTNKEVMEDLYLFADKLEII